MKTYQELLTAANQLIACLGTTGHDNSAVLNRANAWFAAHEEFKQEDPLPNRLASYEDSIQKLKLELSDTESALQRRIKILQLQADELRPVQKDSRPAAPHGIKVTRSIKDLQLVCYANSSNAGWWDGDDHNIAEKLCLIHSEVSEAMEGYRKDLMDDKLPHRKMIEVELADAVIRILDLSGYMGLDLEGAILEKLEFNRTRPDHTREARAAEGGKKF